MVVSRTCKVVERMTCSSDAIQMGSVKNAVFCMLGLHSTSHVGRPSRFRFRVVLMLHSCMCPHSVRHLQGRLHGIITCDHGKLDKLKTESVEWAPDLKKMLAVCNDLVPLTKGQLVGSLDEKRAFAAVEASFVVSERAQPNAYAVCSHLAANVSHCWQCKDR